MGVYVIHSFARSFVPVQQLVKVELVINLKLQRHSDSLFRCR